MNVLHTRTTQTDPGLETNKIYSAATYEISEIENGLVHCVTTIPPYGHLRALAPAPSLYTRVCVPRFYRKSGRPISTHTGKVLAFCKGSHLYSAHGLTWALTARRRSSLVGSRHLDICPSPCRKGRPTEDSPNKFSENAMGHTPS
jgi:hypothetical protein